MIEPKLVFVGYSRERDEEVCLYAESMPAPPDAEERLLLDLVRQYTPDEPSSQQRAIETHKGIIDTLLSEAGLRDKYDDIGWQLRPMTDETQAEINARSPLASMQHVG